MTIMQIKTYISNKKEQFIKWFFSKVAKYKLLWKKQEDIAVFKIMEAYITELVLDGDENRRTELAEMQRKIEEFSKFVKFIKKL